MIWEVVVEILVDLQVTASCYVELDCQPSLDCWPLAWPLSVWEIQKRNNLQCRNRWYFLLHWESWHQHKLSWSHQLNYWVLENPDCQLNNQMMLIPEIKLYEIKDSGLSVIMGKRRNSTENLLTLGRFHIFFSSNYNQIKNQRVLYNSFPMDA